jgi:hypothetical protein
MSMILKSLSPWVVMGLAGCCVAACGGYDGNHNAAGGQGGSDGGSPSSGGTGAVGGSKAGASGAGGSGGTGQGGSVNDAGAGGVAGIAGTSGNGGAAGTNNVGGGGIGATGGTGATGATGGAQAGVGGSAAGTGGVTSGQGGTAGGEGGSAGDSAGAAGTGGEPSKTIDVLTRSNDNQRSGANLRETILNTSNVNKNQFGKLFELPVDDQIYSQILYASELQIDETTTRNVIFVATQNNSVYAFDADTKAAWLWHRNFNGTGRPMKNTDSPGCGNNYRDFSGNIGIVGTPVIDRATNTMYFVSRTVEPDLKSVQVLRAVDIRTGADRQTNASKVIQGSVAGSGNGSVGGVISFDPFLQNQRPGLALHQGTVYIAWASFCDYGNYHGWAMAYDGATLNQVGIYNTTTAGGQGGIWHAGGAPFIDGVGNVYLATGNGSWNGTTNFSNSVLKLAPKSLTRLSYFTASNWGSLNGADLDLGSGGPTLLPGTNAIVLAGKEGKVYVLDTANLGGLATNDAQILDSFQIVDKTARPTANHHLHNTMVVWDSPQGLNLYAAGENDYLRAWRFDRTTRKFLRPSAVVSSVLPPVGMPGGMLALSADGSKSGTGIVWSMTPRAGDANNNVTPGIIRAFDAENLALLWESSSIADDIYDFGKFNNPTIVNGKVFVPSFTKVLSVFGLRDVVPPAGTNLALGKTVTTPATSCNGEEGPSKVVDGKIFTQVSADKFKWCSHTTNAYVVIDLGAAVDVNRIIIHHAGNGGEVIDFNTRAFQLQLSTDNLTFNTVVDVTANTLSKTTHTFATTSARYVKMLITDPAQNNNTAARIYEIEVYGP